MREVLIPKEKLDKKRWFIIALDMLLAMAVLFLLLIFLALQNDENKVKTTELKKSLPSKVLTGAFSGQEISLDSNEMENFLNFIIGQHDDKESTIKLIGIKTEQGKDTARIYIPFSYQKLNFTLCSDIKAEMEGDQGGIKVRFKNPKIGKLPIPMKCLNFILKKLTVQNLNIKNEVLYIDSCFTIKIGNKPVTLEIGDFRILNGNFIFKIYGADSAVKSFVNRTLKGVLEI